MGYSGHTGSFASLLISLDLGYTVVIICLLTSHCTNLFNSI